MDRTCPNCGRLVESGFKFCDGCGTRLEPAAVAAPMPTRPAPEPVVEPEPTQPIEPPAPKPAALPPLPKKDPSVDEPVKERKPPLFQRLREQREEKSQAREKAAAASAAEDASKATGVPTLSEADATPLDEMEFERRPLRPAGAVSQPKTAEELRGAKPSIGGRLRWSGPGTEGAETETRPEDTAALPTLPTPAPRPVVEPKGITPGWIGVFILHLILSMLAGAILVGGAAAIASLVSNGKTALLEIRGLPIFIAGATAVMVFTLLRTGRQPEEAQRRRVIVSVVIGFIILVAASTFLYQPKIVDRAQTELEQVLGVYGPDETEAVQSIAADVDQWNAETTRYRDEIVSPALQGQIDLGKFQVDASGSEERLSGIVTNMKTHAEIAGNENLQEGLSDLAEIYADRLAAITLLTRGLVTNNQELLTSGESRRDESKTRAVNYFDRELQPLLERADIDPAPLANSVAGGF